MRLSFLRLPGAGPVLAMLLAVSLTAPLAAASPADDDWPQFRGPGGHGVSHDTRIPTEWSDTKNLKWKLQLPGPGFSSPIVVGDHVFVTCYSEATGNLEKLKRHLVCVNRRQGTVVWSKVVPPADPELPLPGMAAHHGFASHTPVSDGERIYVMFGNTGVLAFDRKGNPLWRKSVGKEGAAMFGSASSPILYKDKVIVTAGDESRTIRAFDTKTGKELWKTSAANPLSRCYSTPSIVQNSKGEDELLISVTSEVWGLNPQTGKLKWYARTPPDTAACPSLVSQGDIAYVIGGRRGGRAAVRVGGDEDVTKTHVLWSTSGGSYVPSPVLHKGRLYWVNDRGVVTCVDLKTGEEVARKRIRGQFYASVVLIREKLYAVSRFGGTYVLEATPELKQIAHNKLTDDSDFSGSPAVSDGQLIFRSEKFLYCVAAD